MLWVVPSQAARPTLSFLKAVDLPDLRIRIKLIPDARETPPPSPAVYTYEFKGAGRSWKEDRYAPVEMWRHSQFAGQWVGRFDNRLVLATMTCLFAGEVTERHMTREAYENKIAGMDPAITAVQTEASVARWMADFTGCPALDGKRLESVSTRVSPIIRYRFDGAGGNRVAYAFRLNRQPLSVENTASPWICALFELNPDIKLESACQAIERDFLGSLTLLASSSVRSSKPALGENHSFNKKSGDDESGDLMSARRQVVESIRNMNGWWYDASAHYILLSNQKGSQKVWVDQLHKAMDMIRGAYARCIPENPTAAISVIRLPATGEEYTTYVGAEYSWTGGVWMPGRKELVIRPMGDGNRDKRKNMIRLAFHEGFHQYAFYAFKQADSSLWFNEGYAELFANAVFANGRVKLEEDPRAMMILKGELGGPRCDLRALFHMSREQFYNPNKDVREANYAMAWGLVYYLKKGVEADPASPFSKLLSSYVEAMRKNGGKEEDATITMLEGVDIQKLEADFRRFWHSPTRLAAARRYDPFASK